MLDLVCVPAPDGVAVPPCGTVEGVALHPVMVPPEAGFDGSSGPGLFGWSITLLAGAFVVGLVVGSIIRIIRAA